MTNLHMMPACFPVIWVLLKRRCDRTSEPKVILGEVSVSSEDATTGEPACLNLQYCYGAICQNTVIHVWR